ncbi:MAG: TM2 domain-containing protein [Roseiflexaceae bacterium]|nr:TM2 domain-containing protein [Roseiflexaceae bacterium]
MVTCPSCDTENPPDAHFCTHCGATIAPEPVQTPAETGQLAPSAPQPAAPIVSPQDSRPIGYAQQPPPNYPTPPAYPAPTYPAYAPRPPKDRSVALILELLPGLFGFLGFGWIYSGNTSTGLLWLGGVLAWSLIAVVIFVLTAGVGCFCTVPVNIALIALSVSSLNTYMKQHPELFG